MERLSARAPVCSMEDVDIPDPSDWLSTSLPSFSPLENLLHCQICKEFYNTPMITSCAHTFCSKCIRTSLSATSGGKCPVCLKPDQASKLRNNWAVQEIVTSFLAARKPALALARKSKAEEEEDEADDTETGTRRRRGKRKRAATDVDPDDEQAAPEKEPEEGRRTTRSKARRLAGSQESPRQSITIDDTDSEDGTFEPEPAPPIDDGLVECPLGCGRRMKIEAVEPHLDKCEDERIQAEKQRRQQEKAVAAASARRGVSLASHQNQLQSQSQSHINELHYSGLKDQAFARKLKDLGIPSWGNKVQMTNRHREWVNIWNANCDSDRPRSKRDLLHDLDVWERTQGAKAPSNNISFVGNGQGLGAGGNANPGSAVMKKDFDSQGYMRSHQDDFSRLIAEARKARMKPSVNEGEEKAKEQAGPNDAGSSPVQENPINNPVTDAPLPTSTTVSSSVSTERSAVSQTEVTIPSSRTDPVPEIAQERDHCALRMTSEDKIAELARKDRDEINRAPGYTQPPAVQRHS